MQKYIWLALGARKPVEAVRSAVHRSSAVRGPENQLQIVVHLMGPLTGEDIQICLLGACLFMT